MLVYSSSILNYNQFSTKGDLFVIALTASGRSGLYFLELMLCCRETEKTVTLILMALDFMVFSLTLHFPLHRYFKNLMHDKW